MQVTVNGITAKVEWAGHRKSRTDDGPRVVIRYQLPWVNADGFADSVMGGYVVTGGVPRYLPRHACPTNPVLYCLTAEIDYEAERDDTALPTVPPAMPGPALLAFDTAHVEVLYGNLTWPQITADDPQGDQSFQLESAPNEPILQAECEIDHGGQAITMPTGSLVFVSDGLKIDAPLTKWEGIDVWRIVRHNFPNLPYKQVRSLKNRVNNSTFLGQERGCVRFANARSSGTMTGQGFKCQRFEIIFEVKDQDWNQFIRPDDLTYDDVGGAADNSKTPYKYTDSLPGLLT